jgi:anti-anti-sigma factor
VTWAGSRLTIEIAVSANQRVFKLNGEVDLVTSRELDVALAGVCAGEPRTIILDLRNVTFMDVRGLRSLLAAHTACGVGGHELRIIPGRSTRRLFEVTKTESELPLTSAVVTRGDVAALIAVYDGSSSSQGTVALDGGASPQQSEGIVCVNGTAARTSSERRDRVVLVVAERARRLEILNRRALERRQAAVRRLELGQEGRREASGVGKGQGRHRPTQWEGRPPQVGPPPGNSGATRI